MNLHAVLRSIKHPNVPVMDGRTYDRLMEQERQNSEDDDYVALIGYLKDMWMEDNTCLGLFSFCGDPYIIELPDYGLVDVEGTKQSYPNGFAWGWEMCEDYLFTGGPR